ncbi:MAG TPA: threonine synthase [Terriglobales bacterium]|nr:threonine synthase [Terriglobales bacterium]
MSYVLHLQCVSCGRQYSTRVPYTCPGCGITGILDVQYDYAAVRRLLSRKVLLRRVDQSHWRYRELLPIAGRSILPGLQVGWTPICDVPKLAHHVGVRSLRLKDEGRNPTGSLKDRASSVAVVRALSKRSPIVACASTGNAASSLAGMAASLGLRSVIFVPHRAPEPKVTQLLIFGATVFRVQGGYDDAFRLSHKACERWNWYNRNCAINPYLVEGKKTVGLEIAEQLGWQVPEWVALSVGDGCTIAGAWKAFRELRVLDLIDRTPRMLGVQAAGAAPVTEAFRTGASLRPVVPDTIADSIAVGVPRNWQKALTAVRESGGTMINVTDDEILDAVRYTGMLAGVFAEPAAAASVAGLRRAVSEGIISRHSSAMAIITGSGLKDIRAAQKAVSGPFEVAPDGGGLEEIVRRQGLISAESGAAAQE